MTKPIHQIVGILAIWAAAFASPTLAYEPIQSDFTLGDDGRIYIQAQVAGQNLRALVDTGLSSPFLMTPQTAARLPLRYIPLLRTAPLQGIDGQGVRGRITGVKITALGGATGDWDIAAVVVDIPILNAQAMVGMDFLDGYDVHFDFKVRRMILTERDQGAVSPGGFINCNAAKPSFSLDDRCDSSMVYIDTGGQTTLMNSSMAALLGVDLQSSGIPIVIRGASGRAVSGVRYDTPIMLRGLDIASFVVTDLRARRGCAAPCAELVLGMDTLGQYSALRLTQSFISITP